VRGSGPTSVEEFFTRRLGDAHVLVAAAQGHAAADDAVSAVATMLAADTAVLQALLWERVNISPRTPQRQFFQAAQALTGVMGGVGTGSPVVSAADLVADARAAMATALDDDLALAVRARWADAGFLVLLHAPTEAALRASLADRTDGLGPEAFVVDRRQRARALMAEAQAARVRGDTPQAIRLAYDSDFLAVDAYLAESALATGDARLLTAIPRWALVAAGVAGLPGLPDTFTDAVELVREAMTNALGGADGGRLADAFA
jgi:hypothetical protein